MFYNSEDIDEDFKCSVCKKFTGDFRLIPDCGESICDGCYEELKNNVDKTGFYKCLACKDLHTMPENGLPNNKNLNGTTKRRKMEKSLSDEAKTLKSLVKSFNERIKALEEFNGNDYINYHCDELEIQVMEQTESLVKELSEIEKDLLKQISEYRKSSIDAWSKRRVKKDASTTQETTDQTARAFRNEAAQFSSKWADYFSRIDAIASEPEVGDALGKARILERKLDIAHKQLRSEALNGHTMTFMAHDWLVGEQSPLRRAIRLTIQDDRDKQFQISSSPSDMLIGHSDQISQILYLENGNLASCSEDHTIRIWDPLKGTMLFMLEGHQSMVKSIALLWNGWLASSSFDKTIKIWDLYARREIRTIEGKENAVGKLLALKNGNLASYSLDSTIKIWNPYLTENNLMLTISVHQGAKWDSSYTFGILSNDNLVTLTCPVKELSLLKLEKTLKVWNTNNGQLVKSVSFKFPTMSALLVLANDQVALGAHNGTIKIVDLDDEAASISMKVSSLTIYALAELPNGNLVSCSSDYGRMVHTSICVLDPKRYMLLQKIATGHTDEVVPMAISPGAMILATGSFDHTIKLWSIN